MEILEHKIENGEIYIDFREKILSFGIDNGVVFFWGLKPKEKTKEPPTKYIVVNVGDKVKDNWHHVATLIEGVKSKHIFVEYIPPKDQKPKKITKIITDKGVETVETE